MNSIHDMGGMHNMGSIVYEKAEPVFHARWEERIFALSLAMRNPAPPEYNLRIGVERLPPDDYLHMSYYERWIPRLVNYLRGAGLASQAEIETGRPDPGSRKAKPTLTAAEVPGFVAGRRPAARTPSIAPRFKAGDAVIARNINPVGHTRLPRYARGRRGTVMVDYGVSMLPDADAADEKRLQHLYSVKFTGRDLWGDQASPRDAVYIDLWDDYLERV